MSRDPRLLFNVSFLAASQVISQLLNVFALFFVARVLGTERFGLVQIGVALSAYALLIGELGLMSLGIRDLSRLPSRDAAHAYVRSHLGLLSVMAFVTLGLSWLILPRLPFYAQAPWVFWIYVGLVIPQLFMLDWVANGLQNQKWTGIFWIVRSAAYAGIVGVLLTRDSPPLLSQLLWVPVAYFGAHLIADAVLWLRMQRALGTRWLWPQWDPTVWRSRLAQAAPIGVSLVVMRLLYNIDIVLLGSLADATAAGVYAAASKLVQVLVIASEVVWKVLLPRLSQLWSTSTDEFRSAFNRYAGLALLALTPVAIGGSLLAADLIRLIYRDAFDAAAIPLARLAVAYPLIALGIFLGNGLIARDRQHRYLPSVAVAAALMVGLNLWWIPEAGAAGASWAALVASMGLVVATGWQMRDQLSRDLWRPTIASLLGGVAMAMVIRVLSTPVVVTGSVGLVVYASVAAIVYRTMPHRA